MAARFLLRFVGGSLYHRHTSDGRLVLVAGRIGRPPKVDALHADVVADDLKKRVSREVLSVDEALGARVEERAAEPTWMPLRPRRSQRALLGMMRMPWKPSWSFSSSSPGFPTR
jgi:hypothetical protein